MQIQGNSAGGPLSVVGGILRDEGAFGLTRGLSASLLRQGVYSSTRFGVYDIGKQYLTNNGQTSLPLHYKVANGLVSGAIGAAVGSPADLAMVRMQVSTLYAKMQNGEEEEEEGGGAAAGLARSSCMCVTHTSSKTLPIDEWTNVHTSRQMAASLSRNGATTKMLAML